VIRSRSVLSATAMAFVAAGSVALPASPDHARYVERPSSPAAIARFIARAERSLDGAFVATYRISESTVGGGTDHLVQHAAQLSRRVFMYEQGPDDKNVWVEQSQSVAGTKPGIWFCSRPSKAGSWTCQKTRLGAMGEQDAEIAYEPKMLTYSLENASSVTSQPDFISTRSIGGRRLTCLASRSSTRPVATWCIAASGVPAYYQASVPEPPDGPGTARMTALSTKVPRTLFRLPAPVTGR